MFGNQQQHVQSRQSSRSRYAGTRDAVILSFNQTNKVDAADNQMAAVAKDSEIQDFVPLIRRWVFSFFLLWCCCSRDLEKAINLFEKKVTLVFCSSSSH